MSWIDHGPAAEPALTREVLDRAMRQMLDAPPPTKPVYIVAPDRVKQGYVALAYLHGHVTHAEYRRLYFIQEWLRRSERGERT